MTSINGIVLNGLFRFRQLVSPTSRPLNVSKERAEFERLAPVFKSLVKLNTEPVDVNGVPGEWVTPPRVEGGRTVLYLHGGYYVLGSIRSYRNMAGNVAAAARARALIVDYRLAPEHPFPAALDDALTAYHWLLEHEATPEQITLAGDSAGGGLALALLLFLRERGEPLPAAAVCMSPATDLSLSGETWRTNARKDVVVSRYLAEQAQLMYLRDTDPCNPLASPLFAGLHGLPPILIQVGSDEFVLSDSICFAECARSAGVDVTLEVWPGMQHVWQFCASLLPEGRQALTRIGDFIRAVSG